VSLDDRRHGPDTLGFWWKGGGGNGRADEGDVLGPLSGSFTTSGRSPTVKKSGMFSWTASDGRETVDTSGRSGRSPFLKVAFRDLNPAESSQGQFE
jgi:hypothetical protein